MKKKKDDNKQKQVLGLQEFGKSNLVADYRKTQAADINRIRYPAAPASSNPFYSPPKAQQKVEK